MQYSTRGEYRSGTTQTRYDGERVEEKAVGSVSINGAGEQNHPPYAAAIA